LAIDASGRDDVNASARREADERRVLLNVVDRAHLCDWIAPAIVRRGPLQVSVSTSGESPYLAAALRRRLEQDLGAEWEPFTRLVGEIRRGLRARGVSPEEQEAVYAALHRSDVRRLLRDGGRRVAQERTNQLLREAARSGAEVVRLKGGDPFVFGRGGEEAALLAEAGVEVRVIPGVSAATAAPALAGIPLTLRGVASSV